MVRLLEHHILALTCLRIISKIFCQIFHIVDNSLDVPKNRSGYDPLFCVRLMIEMMERTF